MLRRLHFVIAGSVLLLACNAHGDTPDAIRADEECLRAAGIGTEDAALIEFVRSKTLEDADRDKIAALIRDLGADDFAVREKASGDLVKMGGKAASLLRQAKTSRDVEVARRASECLGKIDEKNGPTVTLAAMHLLAARKPAATAQVLLKFAPLADDHAVLEGVRETLTAVAVRDGKPEPALTDALGSKQPFQRGLAGEALVRAGQADTVPAVRKLLDDPNHEVGVRVGLAFVDKKDKSVMPKLIELMADLPHDQAQPILDVLERIALGKAPEVVAGDDEAARKKCRDAWSEWWTKNGESVDLAKITLKLVVVMETSQGTIKIELFPDKAPGTVKNFVQYVEDGHYNGLIFHRVIAEFMIQGGGYEPGMKEKQTRDPIKNESSNNLSNERGTIAMARTSVPDSATSQFYINVRDNLFLDKAQSRDGVGYCVFGKVIDGMDVVDKIKAVKTGAAGGLQDVPLEDVVIKSARVVR